MFEQDNLSTLASLVFFSKVDIVKMILKDPEVIGKCLNDLKDPKTPAPRQAELCGFLKGKLTFLYPLLSFFRIFRLLTKPPTTREGKFPGVTPPAGNLDCD